MSLNRNAKKQVSWSDGKDEGKISEEHLQVGIASTPKRAILNDEMKGLIKRGYNETEAAAIVGKPLTISDELMLKEPVFYDSKETIDAARQRYSFFTKIALGVATVTAVAVVGVLAINK